MIKFIKNLFVKEISAPDLPPPELKVIPFPILFSDIKERLTRELQNKLIDTPIPNENGFFLIEGFMPLYLNKEISSNLILGGTNVPTVGIVGKNSGRIYLFALKAVLTDLEF
jgi:hypothetical protein